MSKKRPSTVRQSRASREPSHSRADPQYWLKRLYKNTFTYKGRRAEVKGWSVKIQWQGERKTIALRTINRTKAAAEACRIFQSIVAHGWDAALNQPKLDPANSDSVEASPRSASDSEQWKSRLIQRRYPEPTNPVEKREFSVRIEHAGTSQYFPLGTTDEVAAARRAMRIHECISRDGWEIANRKFTRELTLAFRWLDDPLAWTYTTIHTRIPPTQHGAVLAKNSSAVNVAIIERDIGISSELAANVNSQNGFQCSAVFSSIDEARREIARRPTTFVLVNTAALDVPPAVWSEELSRIKPGIFNLIYSVFEDSDELFAATPGGAAGYMLKRTPASRIFEPLADSKPPLTREVISLCVREYFQKLVAAMPAGQTTADLASLTPREHEILALLAKGQLTKEIAVQLGISVWTVHGHVKSIFDKLNVHTRTEAVVKFLQK